jgi:TonB family protein
VKAPPRTAPTGPDSAKAAELIAQARTAPTSQQALASVMRSGEPVMSSRTFTAATPTANATRVTSAPDPRLSGREVYMMAIQMPNLTSFSGSWLMWYAATTATEVSAAPLAPPVAHRKVDPKYVATAAEERVQGNVRLACRIDGEGHVSRVELLHGLDARLDQTAADALSRWEFYPATRGGEPVAVDVVVEIPFRLAPTKTGKK